MYRRPFVFLGAFAALAAPAVAAPAAPAPVVVEEQVILPAEGPYAIDLENMHGRVTVRGWNKNVVYVRAEKRATHPLSGSEAAIFARVRPAVVWHQDGEAAIRTDMGEAAKTYPAVLLAKAPHVVVDYTLVVPSATALRIKQEQGPVVLYGVDGKFEIRTRDGAIDATDVAGRVEATNERGDMRFSSIKGDAVASSQSGRLIFRGVEGDIRARTHDGDVRIDVAPRFVGEVSFHTVSGLFRSDLATTGTDLQPGDKGYVGVLRGPLAGAQAPEARFRIDTVSGTATVAADRQARR